MKKAQFVSLQCPICHQEILVWPGVQATCVGENGGHRRVEMKQVVPVVKAEYEGQESLLGVVSPDQQSDAEEPK